MESGRLWAGLYVVALVGGTLTKHWWIGDGWVSSFCSALLMTVMPLVGASGAEWRRARKRQAELHGQQQPSDVEMT